MLRVVDGLAMTAERTRRARASGPCALACGRLITEGQRIGRLAPRRWAHVACIRARLEAPGRDRAADRASPAAAGRSGAPEGERVGGRAEAAEAAVAVLF